MKKNTGQFVIGVGIAISMLLAAVGGASAFFVGQGNQNSKIEVLINEDENINEKIDDWKAEMNKRFDRLEDLIRENNEK